MIHRRAVTGCKCEAAVGVGLRGSVMWVELQDYIIFVLMVPKCSNIPDLWQIMLHIILTSPPNLI